MKEECCTCYFYRRNQCRKAPPVRLPRAFAPEANAGNRVREERIAWGWPAVPADGWCGEFRSKT